MSEEDIRAIHKRAVTRERNARARFNRLDAETGPTSLRHLKALADARQQLDVESAEVKRLAKMIVYD